MAVQTDLLALAMHAQASERDPGIGLVWNVCAAVAGVVFVVDDEQNDAQEETDGAHRDVGDAQERVLSPHPGNGAQDHPLASIKAEHGVIWLHAVKKNLKKTAAASGQSKTNNSINTQTNEHA